MTEVAMAEQAEEVRESFDDFVRSRGPVLWRSAWLLTRDRGKAEDLVQTALAKTYARFDRLNATGSYEPYLRRTMYTTFVSWWRRKWNAEVPIMTAEVTVTPHGVGPEVSRDLAVALAGLTKMQRAVIVLRYFEDLTEADTAAALGIAVGSVKSHAHRAIAALRQSPALVDDTFEEDD